jgi:hypothetical protein
MTIAQKYFEQQKERKRERKGIGGEYINIQYIRLREDNKNIYW